MVDIAKQQFSMKLQMTTNIFLTIQDMVVDNNIVPNIPREW